MYQQNNPIYIAGPCSAESEEQVLAIAKFLAENTPVHIFRAGVWKPRTKPGSFEGIGNEALHWLQKVKQQTGLQVATEVATPQHVQEVLNAGIDYLWIGARTSGNPFSMTEIAEALKGKDVAVMVKNPLSPDITLWCGAIERLQNVGIKNIFAIHRGFQTQASSDLKNQPLWHLPIELMHQKPEIPVICDPSHIAGNAKRVFDIAQKAFDLEMKGLMIEVHNNPKAALSDANQQLDFNQAKELFEKIIIKSSDKKLSTIDNYRMMIDELDTEIIHLLAKRMNIVDKIGQCKKENNLTVLQNSRWEEVLAKCIEDGKKQGLNKNFIQAVWESIHAEALKIQTEEG